jgi:protein Mpv17
MNVLSWYNGVLTRKPILTKSLTSFVTFGLGDAICQSIEISTAKNRGKPKKKFDFSRFFKQAIFGFSFSPYFHLHFSKILPFLFPAKPGVSQNVIVFKSMLYDQTVHASIFTIVFYYYMGLVNGNNVEDTTKDLKQKYWPTMLDNWKLWPAAVLINFKFVPIPYQVLYVNMVGIVWMTYLSYLQNIKFAKV